MVEPLSHEPLTRIGLLGAGRMGGPIGRHLLAAGTTVAVYDPSPEAVEPLAALGATACAAPGEVAALSDLVLIVVVDDAQVRDGVTACLETARGGPGPRSCASSPPARAPNPPRAAPGAGARGTASRPGAGSAG